MISDPANPFGTTTFVRFDTALDRRYHYCSSAGKVLTACKKHTC